MSLGDESLDIADVDDRLLARVRETREHGDQRLVRLALDLHDGPLQELAAATSELYLLREQLTRALGADAPAVGAVDNVIGTVDSAVTGVRDVAGAVYHDASQQPLSEGLSAAADLYADSFDVEVVCEPDAQTLDGTRVGDSRHSAILRVVQSALANAAQHSGAYVVRVLACARADQVEVEVWDNGRGFDVDEATRRSEATGHLGLAGMRQRARMLGGSLDIASAPGGPTCIHLTLPARAENRVDHTGG
jgi:signal transduction histidine kinase